MWSRTINSSPAGATASLIDWRRRQLINAGFAPATATAFAGSSADLHRVFELLDRGCPPHLAGRIMAPLDMELPEG